MISPALANIGADANNTAARISDLNILLSYYDRGQKGLLTQYYNSVNTAIIGLTLKPPGERTFC